MYVCMYVCTCACMHDAQMCALLVLEQLDGFYSHSLLMISSILGQCPVNLNIQGPKFGVLQMNSEPKMAIFLKIILWF
jgi:hypothetical protein